MQLGKQGLRGSDLGGALGPGSGLSFRACSIYHCLSFENPKITGKPIMVNIWINGRYQLNLIVIILFHHP